MLLELLSEIENNLVKVASASKLSSKEMNAEQLPIAMLKDGLHFQRCMGEGKWKNTRLEFQRATA